MFDRIFINFAGNKVNHKVSDECEIRPDPTMDCGVSCKGPSEKIPIDLQWEKYCDHSSAFIFDRTFSFLRETKACIQAWMSSNSNQIRQLDTALALKRLKKSRYNVVNILAPSFFIALSSFLQVKRTTTRGVQYIMATCQ